MNIDTLYKNFYKRKETEDLINEVLRFLLAEADIKMPPKATFDWSMIPDIPISEIGWSDVSTNEEGEQILGPQRALLEQYLDNIGVEGGDLQQQIESLEEFYKNGPSKIVTEAGDDRVEVIKKLISYLVFYKTLTKVVTNFNAASAGFTFESFLATLMKGTQIPTNSQTIADFTTGKNIPISLKLYAETTLKVEGSFTDLVNDLVKPKYAHPLVDAMRYVICTKRITGDGLKQTGTIGFYQFDFTLKNVMSILSTSMDKSQKNIWLPKQLIETGVDVAGDLPAADKLPSAEKLETEFVERLDALVKATDFRQAVPDFIRKIDPEFPSDADMEEILQVLEYSRERKKFFNDWKGLGRTTMKDGPVRDVLVQYFMSKNADKVPATDKAAKVLRTSLGQLQKAIKAANDAIVDRLSASEVNKVRAELIGKIEFEKDLDVILKYYNDPKLSDDARKVALKNTFGYINVKQFALNRAQSTDPSPPISTEKLGVITIGGAEVEKMLKEVSRILDKEIFTVFTSLKTLSDSLNSFFAGGLSDGDLAVQAITSADEIQKKTAEHSGQKTGGSGGAASSMAGPVPTGQRRYIHEE